MKRLIVLCASAALCLAVAVRADWKSVPLSGGARGCQESGSGVVVPMTDAKGKAYTSASSGTTACNGARDLWAVLTGNSAEAASLRFTLGQNPDGTRDTGNPCLAADQSDCKPPAAPPAWDDSCVATALDPITNQQTGVATSIDLTSCKTGTNASSATCTLHAPVTGWSIGSSTCVLANAGSSAGSWTTLGSIQLDLTFGDIVDTTAAFHWTYSAPITSATKFEPGWYGLLDTQCKKYNGSKGCTLAYVLSTINSEICSQQYVQGIAIQADWNLLENDIADHYTDSADRGFPFWDAVVSALASCGKKLDVTFFANVYGSVNAATDYYPAYLISTGSGGTCSSNCTTTEPVHSTAYPGQGWVAPWWETNTINRMKAVIAAYCARYDSNPAWYSLSWEYDSSLPMTDPSQVAAFNTNYLALNAYSRSVCPTMNIRFGVTWVYGSTIDATARAFMESNAANDTDIRPTDVYFDKWSDAQAYFTGMRVANGIDNTSGYVATGTDYRGVQRFTEEIEFPDMCGSKGSHTPADFMGIFQNGDSTQRPRYTNRIVVAMTASCPAGYDWAAYKTYIQSIQGKVMNGRDNTLRTPAEVKASGCESGMTCQ